MSKKDDAIREMNRLGGRGEPFLFVIDFDMEAPEVLTPSGASDRGILYDIGGATNARLQQARETPLTFRKFPLPFADYRLAFDAVQAELGNGNSYLLNLTFPTRIETDLGLGEIFHAGPAKYRLLFPGRFVCFSPERFVRISDGVISSCPMKGTIDASAPDAEAAIMENPKELAEHTTIVDLIRNDLNMVSTGVKVERFRYIDRISTNRGEILQVSSLITGRLPGDYRERIGTILFSMLPAGSVTGAPKKKTVEIIRRVEAGPRGFYTGIAGYFDGTTLDSGVMIRFIERTNEGMYYRSGGGITAQSDAESEYDEMVGKVYVPAF
ncbi:MAG TPA: aminodeoxychorismate synthase component I [Bacteroidota bacterium]|nr:aminodeoxychorismate synthase component I [Bacteroidota bacterium]